MFARRSLLLVVLLLLPTCAATRPEPARAETVVPDVAERESILAVVRGYYADLSARDWEAFADHFWTGATITTTWSPPGEGILGRVVVDTVPRFVARDHEGPSSKVFYEGRMQSADVRVTRNLAQVWASYEVRLYDQGDVVWRGIDAFTLMQHEGRWRITGLTFTEW